MLNKDDGWNANTTSGGYKQYYKSISAGIGGTNVISALSNCFIYGGAQSGNNFYINGSKTLIVFIRPILNGTDIATTDDWKAFLLANAVYIYYVLATPTTEDIDLPAIQMWSGTNIFTIGTEVQPSSQSWEYITTSYTIE